MNLARFSDFQSFEAKGLKLQAKVAIQEFVASFNSDAERLQWSKENWPNLEDSVRIRHELFVGVIFPALYSDYLEGGEWGLTGLASSIQNLYKNDALWALIDHATPLTLLKKGIQQFPGSKRVKELLLRELLADFDYAAHEWPAGILIGPDSTDSDGCDELIEDAHLALTLTESDVHVSRIHEFLDKVHAYKDRLQKNT